jgi:hypothetical protein
LQLIRHNAAAMTIEVSAKANETLTVMLASDIHFDAATCDLALFTKHLKLAEELQAPVFIGGDFFDAMQGHDDPRRSMEDLKREYKVSNYFDAIVLDGSNFLRQFKVPYYIIGLGNHETSVLSKSSTNLCERLAYDLRVNHQAAEAAGYWGYLRFKFQYENGGGRSSKLLYWHHGTSNSAPVTKGVIDVARQGVYLYSPDIVLNGHNHHAYTMPVVVERVNQKTMEPYTETMWYVRTPGYKMSAADSMSTYGFGAEKFRAPTPRGCLFLDLNYTHGIGDAVEIEWRQKIV